MIKNNIEVDVKVECIENGTTQAQLAETIGTRLLMQHAAAGTKKEFDLELMLAVMDHITVFEDGRLQIKFYDGTELEVETE